MVQGKWQSKGIVYEDRAEKMFSLILDLMKKHKEVKISQVDRHIELFVKGGPPEAPPPPAAADPSLTKRLF